MSTPMVTVYDTETEAAYRIPAAELAPGMRRVRLANKPELGAVFVHASKLKHRGEYQHGAFAEPWLKEFMQRLSDVFADVYPKTPEQWEDGFRRDLNIEQELAIWMNLEKAFLYFTSHIVAGPGGQEKRQDVFHLLISCVNNERQAAAETTECRTLTPRRKREIVEQFFAGAYSPKDDEGGGEQG